MKNLALIAPAIALFLVACAGSPTGPNTNTNTAPSTNGGTVTNVVSVTTNGNVVTNISYTVVSSNISNFYITSTFGGFGSGDGQFKSVDYIRLGEQNDFYIADSLNYRIQIFTSSGVFIRKWGSQGTGAGQFNSSIYGFAVALGRVFVSSDTRVQVFTTNGIFINSWGAGAVGTGNGQFASGTGPRNIAIENSNRILVVDPGNSRIQVFDTNGIYLTQFAIANENSGNGNHFPYLISIGTNFAISSTTNLSVINPAGTVLSRIYIPPTLVEPALGIDGSWYCPREYNTNFTTVFEISVFSAAGAALSSIGNSGATTLSDVGTMFFFNNYSSIASKDGPSSRTVSILNSGTQTFYYTNYITNVSTNWATNYSTNTITNH